MMMYNMHEAMWMGYWLSMLLLALVVIVPIWRICQRVGYPGWLSLLMLIPIANLGLLYFIAFSRWPIDSGRADPPVPERHSHPGG